MRDRIIALTEFFFNVLVAAQGSSSLPLSGTAKSIDSLFSWLITSPMEVAIILMIVAAIGTALRWWNLAEISFWLSLVFIICEFLFDSRSVDLVFPSILGGVKTQMAYVKVFLIGCLIILSLKFNPKGLLPEVPYRPARPNPVAQSSELAVAAISNTDESSVEAEVIQDE